MGVREDSNPISAHTGLGTSDILLSSLPHEGWCGDLGQRGLNSSAIDLRDSCLDLDFEICAARIKIPNESVMVVNCYRSPSGDVAVYMEKISEVLKCLCVSKKNFILCRHFSFDRLNSNSNYKVFFDVLASFGLSPMVEWPTCVTCTSCTLIEQIFTILQIGALALCLTIQFLT